MSDPTLAEGMSSSKNYKLNDLSIVNGAGQSFPIKEIMVELIIRQSINSPVMFGELLITDGNDLFNTMAMSGTERLRVDIDQPSLEYPLKRDFRIYKVGERAKSGSSGASYVIYFVSQEMIVSSSTLVSKAYKSRRISDMVIDIAINTLKIDKKRIYKIDATAGKFDMVIPARRPFEAINWLSAYGYNTGPDYGYKFFETRDGFEFRSLQGLYSENIKKRIKYELKNVNEEPNQSLDVSKNRNAIDLMTIINDFDVIKSVATGAVASRLLTVNIFDQSYSLSQYNTQSAKGALINEHIPLQDSTLLKSYFSNFKVYAETETLQKIADSGADKWMIQRQLHTSLLDNFKIRAVLPGDITMKAGEIVHVEFPKFVAADEGGKKLDEFRTGKYIIESIIQKFDNREIFESILELSSDSVSSPLPVSSTNVDKAMK